jgi:hypothetical protein
MVLWILLGALYRGCVILGPNRPVCDHPVRMMRAGADRIRQGVLVVALVVFAAVSV